MIRIYIFSCLIFLVLICACRDSTMENQQNQGSDNTPKLFNQYDPSGDSAFGSVNVEAPPQTTQFDFMVGNFVCDDSLLVNGIWQYSKATWETEYILNGYGIKDTYRNNSYAGTSIRFFNTKKAKWEVYFFGMPGEHTGVWEGEKMGDQMVMKQKRTGPNGENLESRLTFYNIRSEGFDWKGEQWNLEDSTVTVDWKIKAYRK